MPCIYMAAMATAGAAMLGAVMAARLALVLPRQAHNHSRQQLRRCRPVLADWTSVPPVLGYRRAQEVRSSSRNLLSAPRNGVVRCARRARPTIEMPRYGCNLRCSPARLDSMAHCKGSLYPLSGWSSWLSGWVGWVGKAGGSRYPHGPARVKMLFEVKMAPCHPCFMDCVQRGAQSR